MLPFLKPRKATTVMMNEYSGGKQKEVGEMGQHSDGILSAAGDLISAVHSKDPLAVADALAAHQEMYTPRQDDSLDSEG